MNIREDLLLQPQSPPSLWELIFVRAPREEHLTRLGKAVVAHKQELLKTFASWQTEVAPAALAVGPLQVHMGAILRRIGYARTLIQAME